MLLDIKHFAFQELSEKAQALDALTAKYNETADAMDSLCDENLGMQSVHEITLV